MQAAADAAWAHKTGQGRALAARQELETLEVTQPHGPWLKRRAWLPVELWIACVTLAISAINLGVIVWLVVRLRALP